MATHHSKSLFKFYTYIHTRADDGMVFYVGKGAGKMVNKLDGRNTRWIRTAKKHGWKSHIYAYFISESDCFKNEIELIALYRKLNHPLVNMTDGGEGMSGATFSDETRRKISEAHKGKKKNPEHVRKSADAQRGKKLSPDHIAKVSASLTGIKRSDETRAKISDAAKKRGISAETRIKGRQAWLERNEEIRAKISASLTGKKLSEESIRKRSATNTGSKRSEQARKNMSIAAKKRGISPETRGKINAAKKGKPWSEARWAAFKAKKEELKESLF